MSHRSLPTSLIYINPVDCVSYCLSGQLTLTIFDVCTSLKRFDPQIWLPTLAFAWGVTSVAQGLVTNQAGLFGIRVRK